MAAITTMLIAAGISAAGSVAGAAIASKSASKAAKQAADGATQAKGELASVYGPYIQQGAAAQATLGGLLGLPMAGGTGGTGAPGAKARPDGAPSLGTAVPRHQAVEDIPGGSPNYTGTGNATPTLASLARSQSSYSSPAPMMAAAGPTVRMQAPDGSQRDVPMQSVERYMARGATVVGDGQNAALPM